MSVNDNARFTDGSALVVLLLFLIVLMICATVIMKFSAQIGDTAHVREQSLQHMYATEAMVLYGIGWCRENRDSMVNLFKDRLTHTIYQGPWQWQEDVSWHACISLSPVTKGLIIEASLYRDKQLLAKQACIVELVEDATVKIAEWQFL